MHTRSSWYWYWQSQVAVSFGDDETRTRGPGAKADHWVLWRAKEVDFLWLPIPFRPKGKKCSRGTRDARQGLWMISRFLLPTDYFRVHCARLFEFQSLKVAFLIHLGFYSVSFLDFEVTSHCDVYLEVNKGNSFY
jgi:hypothetical protein